MTDSYVDYIIDIKLLLKDIIRKKTIKLKNIFIIIIKIYYLYFNNYC